MRRTDDEIFGQWMAMHPEHFAVKAKNAVEDLPLPVMKEAAESTNPKTKRGWPKGKPRGPRKPRKKPN